MAFQFETANMSNSCKFSGNQQVAGMSLSSNFTVIYAPVLMSFFLKTGQEDAVYFSWYFEFMAWKINGQYEMNFETIQQGWSF